MNEIEELISKLPAKKQAFYKMLMRDILGEKLQNKLGDRQQLVTQLQEVIRTDVLGRNKQITESIAKIVETNEKWSKELILTNEAILREIPKTKTVPPKVQDVKVINPQSPPKVQAVKVQNPTKPLKSVKVTNLKDIEFPSEIDINEVNEPPWFRQSIKELTDQVKRVERRLDTTLKTRITNPSALKQEMRVTGSGGGGIIPFQTADGQTQKALVDGDGKLLTDVADQVESSFSTGSKTGLGVSAVQVNSVSLTAKQGIEVKAANANSGNVYVGASSNIAAGVSGGTDGFELGAGEGLLIKVDNLNKIWAIGATADLQIFYEVV